MDQTNNVQIIYELDIDVKHYFRIDNNGQIYPLCSFDREEIEEINLTVFAKSNGNKQANVSVSIQV